jgi:hypothetical protein
MPRERELSKTEHDDDAAVTGLAVGGVALNKVLALGVNYPT